MIMLEEGKVLSKKNLIVLLDLRVYRSGNLMNLFGSWSRLVGFIEKDHPDVWAQLKWRTSPPEPPPPVEEEDSSKPDPLAGSC